MVPAARQQVIDQHFSIWIQAQSLVQPRKSIVSWNWNDGRETLKCWWWCPSFDQWEHANFKEKKTTSKPLQRIRKLPIDPSSKSKVKLSQFHSRNPLIQVFGQYQYRTERTLEEEDSSQVLNASMSKFTWRFNSNWMFVFPFLEANRIDGEIRSLSCGKGVIYRNTFSVSSSSPASTKPSIVITTRNPRNHWTWLYKTHIINPHTLAHSLLL